MVKKLRVSLALQPIATALFANSPFTEGKPERLPVVALARSGATPTTSARRHAAFAFEHGIGFERYVDYALDVPMYFVKRGDSYIDVSGEIVPRFLAGKLHELPGERPTMSDWANHLSTIFPEVRLKRYLEMRGADGGPWRRLLLAAGLLGRAALRRGRARCLLGHGEGLDRRRAPEAARRRAEARLQGRDPRHATCSTLAQEMLRLAARGLQRRKRLDRNGRDETRYLRPLEEIDRARHHAGRGTAREVFQRMERLGRSDFRRIRLLTMAKSTPATLALQKAGVAFKLHEYDYDPNAARIGMQAAEALGIEPARLLKTLMAQRRRRDRLRAGAVRSRGESEEARGCRRRQERGDAGRRRGRAHHRLSRRRHLAVRPEEARARVRRAGRARVSDVVCNGGRRGLQVELAPADLMRVLDATAAEIYLAVIPAKARQRA